jgi:hypothetical protein
MSCNIKLRREGKTYPRTCVTCLKSKRCANGLDEDSLIETISKLTAINADAAYAIVTDACYYDVVGTRNAYDDFRTYDEAAFRAQIHKLILSGTDFRAFRIIPVTVTTTVNINIGQ